MAVPVMMTVNPHMIPLARESRGLTQVELALAAEFGAESRSPSTRRVRSPRGMMPLTGWGGSSATRQVFFASPASLTGFRRSTTGSARSCLPKRWGKSSPR